MKTPSARRLLRFCKSDLGLRFMAEAAARGSGFVVTPLLSWTLGAAVFGGYTQILSLSFAFVPIISAGLGYTVIRQVAAGPKPQQGWGLLVFSISFVSFLCVLLASVMLVFSGEINSLISLSMAVKSSSVVLAVSALTWVVAIEALVQEYFRAMRWVRYSLIVQLSALALHLCVLALVFLAGSLSLWSALAVLVLTKLCVIAVVLIVMFLLYSKSDNGRCQNPNWRVLISGIPFMLAGFAEWAGNLGDRLIVGNYLGAEVVAQYTASVMLLSVIVALGAPLWWLLFPEIVQQTHHSNYQRCREIVQQRTMAFVELGLPTLFLLALIADPAISLLVNSNATDMSGVVFLLGAAVFVNQLATGWEYFIVSVSSGKRLMFSTLISSLLGFAIAIYLGPSMGIAGIALGVLSGKVILAFTYCVLANRNGFPGAVWETLPSFIIIAVNVVVFGLVKYLVEILKLSGNNEILFGSACLFMLFYGGVYCVYKHFSDSGLQS
ncbi:lipopolysaccharide biosynthesis protein [Thalassospira lohafexi]|uniref:Polysaccharide biosynthesis protein C-terminal domain-containing protein n=1 Tax=Thalassospira lohafexi TaxID=744227 RepID=A0A2N3LBI9_9PROT|nr:lipopolysaccharide biosynthesis protein [Thalassospira lohafexi]PKR60097.1 hypothetical protein COO92_01620 [Thalassospira lohafexi]